MARPAVGQESVEMPEPSMGAGNCVVEPVLPEPIGKVDPELAKPFVLMRLLEGRGGFGWRRRNGAIWLPDSSKIRQALESR